MTDDGRQTFRAEEIQPNPFRNIEAYPFHKEKLTALRESIRETGFWDNVVARINDRGQPEIAYGHHRLRALREERGPDAEVELIVRDLSDDNMLKIMARENMEEWGSDVWVEMETVRSTVEAYAAGRITLPEVPEFTKSEAIRVAPRFAKGDPRGDGDPRDPGNPRYTAKTLAQFLGWMRGDSDRPGPAVEIALGALEMIERGVLEEDDLKGLSREQAKETIRGARRVRRRKERQAERNEEAAERWEQTAEETDDPEEEQGAREMADEWREKAAERRREAEEDEKKAAKTVSEKLRNEEIGTKQARREASKAAAETPREERMITARDAAKEVATDLATVMSSTHHTVAKKVEELINLRGLLRERDRERVAKALDGVAKRAKGKAERMREPVPDDGMTDEERRLKKQEDLDEKVAALAD